jgi:putative transposase
MPAPKRTRRALTHAWDPIQHYVSWPEQEAYEVIRPMTLFGVTSAERAQETGIAQRTLDRRADLFDAAGMASLFPEPARSPEDRRQVPAEIRQRILDLKAEYPAFHPHEIASILRRRDDCRIHHNTVQRILANNVLPTGVRRQFPLYAHMRDGAERRKAIILLYFDGWNMRSIAGYLETTRTRVYETLYRFMREDFAGLPDKSHVPEEPARKVDLAAMAAVRRLQANPELGAFRIHAALEELGIHLSPRTCGRILAQNRAVGLPAPAQAQPHVPKEMPFAAGYRHEYWSVDVKYIVDHQLEYRNTVYVISVLDNYSRALLASVLSPRQDLTSFLVVLREALRLYGSPTGIVCDGGSIFKANLLLQIYDKLGIERHRIDPGQPWENYIETHFNTLRRMAQFGFSKATTWEEMQAVHARFFHDYNTQKHFAHLQRKDGKRSPQAVLGWVKGIWCDPKLLAGLFQVRADRWFDENGYLRFRHWRVYGERGLAGRHGATWLFGEELSLTYKEELLAQYQVAFAPDGRHIQAVQAPRFFPNRYPSPQCYLPDMERDWPLAVYLPPPVVRWRLAAAGKQQRMVFP